MVSSHCEIVSHTIDRHLKKKDTIGHLYSALHKQYSTDKRYNGHLLMLKSMSSSSPLLYNSLLSSHIFTGGGIYLRWNNKGITIDPGYGFIENMYKHELYIQDIDIVIVTHFHIDHTGDLPLIDDLNRNINGRVPDFDSQDDLEYYGSVFKPKHNITWYVDRDTRKYYMQNFSPLINNIKTIDPSDDIPLEDGIIMHTIPTEHVMISHIKRDEHNAPILDEKGSPSISVSPSDSTFGFRLELTDDKETINIGYSSDAKYSDTLADGLKDCEYLIANISGIYKTFSCFVQNGLILDTLAVFSFSRRYRLHY